jgi:polyphosphate kinase
VFYFENGGEPDMFCASADWMERNFFRRVEVAFPIRRADHAERMLRDLGICLKDNCQAWQLRPDGSYERINRGSEAAFNAQSQLIAVYAAGPGTLV